MIYYRILILVVVLTSLTVSCKENTTQNNHYGEIEKDFDILTTLVKSSKYGIKQLEINEIETEKNDKFRIWRFPEGGAIFEEMYEVNLMTQTLKMNRYLIDGLTKKEQEDYSNINFSREIEQDAISKELSKLVANSNFHLSKNYYEYCEYLPYLSDYYLIEIRKGNTINRFMLGEDIIDCEKKEVQELKKLYEIITKIINKNSE